MKKKNSWVAACKLSSLNLKLELFSALKTDEMEAFWQSSRKILFWAVKPTCFLPLKQN